MKMIDFREDSSRRTTYVKQAVFFATVIIAFFLQASWLSGARTLNKRPELRCNVAALTRCIVAWEFDLPTVAGPNAHVTVIPHACFFQALSGGVISAQLNAAVGTVQLFLTSDTAPPVHADGLIAEVQVHDGAGSLVETWAVKLDGGEVIVVLVDD